MDYTKLSPKEDIQRTIEALKANGINATLVESREDAKKAVLDLIPQGSEVMTYTSITLDESGISEEINGSGKYNAVRDKLYSMDRTTQGLEMNKLGAAPEYAIGSVHAVTNDGKVVIVSNTGSQLPAYAYGSKKVIWVVGTQKIVKDLNSALERIEKHTLPMESERARIAYGVPASAINKTLIIHKEVNPERINVIFVNENIGF